MSVSDVGAGWWWVVVSLVTSEAKKESQLLSQQGCSDASMGCFVVPSKKLSHALIEARDFSVRIWLCTKFLAFTEGLKCFAVFFYIRLMPDIFFPFKT